MAIFCIFASDKMTGIRILVAYLSLFRADGTNENLYFSETHMGGAFCLDSSYRMGLGIPAHQSGLQCLWHYDGHDGEQDALRSLYSSYDKMAYFKMTIEQMDYYDLEPTPPVLRHFDLVSHTESDGFVGERFSKP